MILSANKWWWRCLQQLCWWRWLKWWWWWQWQQWWWCRWPSWIAIFMSKWFVKVFCLSLSKYHKLICPNLTFYLPLSIGVFINDLVCSPMTLILHMNYLECSSMTFFLYALNPVYPASIYTNLVLWPILSAWPWFSYVIDSINNLINIKFHWL